MMSCPKGVHRIDIAKCGGRLSLDGLIEVGSNNTARLAFQVSEGFAPVHYSESLEAAWSFYCCRREAMGL